MTIQIKPGAVVVGSNAVNSILRMAEMVFESYDYDALITSGVDGNHMLNPRVSKHYSLEALDFSFRHIPEDDRDSIWESLRAELGERDYDFVQHSTHWHIEYDPK